MVSAFNNPKIKTKVKNMRSIAARHRWTARAWTSAPPHSPSSAAETKRHEKHVPETNSKAVRRSRTRNMRSIAARHRWTARAWCNAPPHSPSSAAETKGQDQNQLGEEGNPPLLEKQCFPLPPNPHHPSQ